MSGGNLELGWGLQFQVAKVKFVTLCVRAPFYRQSRDKPPLGKGHGGTSKKFDAFFESLFSLALLCVEGRNFLRSSFVTCPLRSLAT